jgi:hypothetical protein
MEKHGTLNNNWQTYILHSKGYEKLDKLTNALKGDNVVPLCITVLFMTTVICIGWYHIHDRSLLAQNMNNAIAKGIDPLAVRCSYVKSDDIICIAFAASAQSHNVAQQTTSRK